MSRKNRQVRIRKVRKIIQEMIQNLELPMDQIPMFVSLNGDKLDISYRPVSDYFTRSRGISGGR